MRAVLQRAKRASVSVDGEIISRIDAGWMILLGITHADQPADVAYLAEKTLHLRAFADAAGKMNRSLLEHGGAVLVVSQFTLYGDCRQGRRPGFSQAAPPEQARFLYEAYAQALRQGGVEVVTGRFAAHMEVELVNDGPVTFLLDSTKAI